MLQLGKPGNDDGSHDQVTEGWCMTIETRRSSSKVKTLGKFAEQLILIGK
jgi:hypothetical protein